jgi:hypothetical protein
MKTCLVVANKTLPSERLAEAIRDRIAGGTTAFYVVVPLAPVDHGLTWDETETGEAAQARLEAFLGALRDQGAEAGGEIGDPDPVQAVRDVLEHRSVDEIVLSTLPPGASRWLQRDVPTRLTRAVTVPVAVVTPELVAVGA